MSSYDFADLTSGGIPADVRLAVIGDPVDHSLSPEFQNAALVSRELPMRYGRLQLQPDELRPAFEWLRQSAFVGWNVTIPHKAAVLALVDEVDPVAQRFGSVNTVVNRAGRLFGFNTDGPGIAAAVAEAFEIDFQPTVVGILGAGGATGRTIARQMVLSGTKQFCLCNRTPEKLAGLQRELSDQAEIRLFQWDQLEQFFTSAGLIINASALGLDGAELNWNPAWINSNHRVFDVVYGAAETPLVRWARRSGAEAVDGLGMLLHQGRLAFEIWFGPPVPVEQMRKALWDAVGRKRNGESASRRVGE